MKKRNGALLAVALLTAVLMPGGCAGKKEDHLNVTRMAEYSDRLGQANVKLFRYAGEADVEDIKTFTEKLGCRMLYAYFYPDTVPIHEIPVEEVRTAGSYTEVQDILFNGEGYARWRFAAQCFAVIPFVSDCYESPVSQNCR
ncbi:MAG: hypothetical protein Kow0089_08270 [Desulfobulbaceae bacterium]